MPKKRFCIGDLAVYLVLAALLAVSLLPLLIPQAQSDIFTVTANGEAEQYSLSEDRVIEVHSCGITLTVTVSDGEVRVTDSTCPDGVCVASRPLSSNSSHRSIVCLPAKVVIEAEQSQQLEGGGEDADFVVG